MTYLQERHSLPLGLSMGSHVDGPWTTGAAKATQPRARSAAHVCVCVCVYDCVCSEPSVPVYKFNVLSTLVVSVLESNNIYFCKAELCANMPVKLTELNLKG